MIQRVCPAWWETTGDLVLSMVGCQVFLPSPTFYKCCRKISGFFINLAGNAREYWFISTAGNDGFINLGRKCRFLNLAGCDKLPHLVFDGDNWWWSFSRNGFMCCLFRVHSPGLFFAGTSTRTASALVASATCACAGCGIVAILNHLSPFMIFGGFFLFSLFCTSGHENSHSAVLEATDSYDKCWRLNIWVILRRSPVRRNCSFLAQSWGQKQTIAELVVGIS